MTSTTSVRAETLRALRTLLLEVDGVPDTWKIYAANRTYAQDDQPKQGDFFIEENALGDDTTDTASSGAGVRWRETTGVYQVTLCFPPDTDVMQVKAFADLIEATFIAADAAPTLADGTPVIIRDSSVRNVLPPSADSFARMPVSFTYSVLTHT